MIILPPILTPFFHLQKRPTSNEYNLNYYKTNLGSHGMISLTLSDYNFILVVHTLTCMYQGIVLRTYVKAHFVIPVPLCNNEKMSHFVIKSSHFVITKLSHFAIKSVPLCNNEKLSHFVIKSSHFVIPAPLCVKIVPLCINKSCPTL